MGSLGEVKSRWHLFRFVCIPPDLHLQFGLSRGRGQQHVWTHFDGYQVMRDRKLRVLAGGDVRFGGVCDVVSIRGNYESERIVELKGTLP